MQIVYFCLNLTFIKFLFKEIFLNVFFSIHFPMSEKNPTSESNVGFFFDHVQNFSLSVYKKAIIMNKFCFCVKHAFTMRKHGTVQGDYTGNHSGVF